MAISADFYSLVKFVSPTTFVSQTSTGKASWTNTARLVDTTLTTSFSTLTAALAVGASSEAFTVGGFDFGYLPTVSEVFYAELHLVMNGSATPTVNIGVYDGATLLYSKSAVCENVNNYKRIALSDINLDLDAINENNIQLSVSLTNTTGSSLATSGSGITAIRLYFRYRDKTLVTSPMGMKLFKANGASIGDGFSTLVRLVAKFNLPFNYTGTISIPGFDDRHGKPQKCLCPSCNFGYL